MYLSGTKVKTVVSQSGNTTEKVVAFEAIVRSHLRSTLFDHFES